MSCVVAPNGTGLPSQNRFRKRKHIGQYGTTVVSVFCVESSCTCKTAGQSFKESERVVVSRENVHSFVVRTQLELARIMLVHPAIVQYLYEIIVECMISYYTRETLLYNPPLGKYRTRLTSRRVGHSRHSFDRVFRVTHWFPPLLSFQPRTHSRPLAALVALSLLSLRNFNT